MAFTFELRENSLFELREDGFFELREPEEDRGGGRVPKDYPHTYDWIAPKAYRQDGLRLVQQLAIHEAAVRLGTKGGIASGKSRRK